MKKKKKKLEPSVASAELGFHRLYMRKLSAASTYIPGYYFSFSFLAVKCVCIFFLVVGLVENSISIVLCVPELLKSEPYFNLLLLLCQLLLFFLFI